MDVAGVARSAERASSEPPPDVRAASGMDDVDRYVAWWAGSVLHSVAVSLGPPDDGRDGDRVSLWLYDLEHTPPARRPEATPWQFSLRYLVSTWSADASTAHRHLGQLVFAAMEHEDLEVDLPAPPVTAWTALGVVPRPAFFLKVLLRRPRPRPEGVYVRSPVVVQSVAVSALEGALLTTDDDPISHAVVTAPSAGRSARTDARGRFVLPAVPAAPGPVDLVVTARGRQRAFSVDRDGDGDAAVVIRWNILEG